MESFEVLQPSAELSPYVKNYWFLKSNATNHVQGVIPTGNISLIFHRGSPLIVEGKNSTLPQTAVSGQTTTYSNLIQSGATDMICVVFQSYGARMFFKMPMHEFKEQSIDLDSLDDPLLSETGKRIQETFDNKTCIRIIEEFLKVRFSHTKEYNLKRLVAVMSAINKGNVDTNKLADISCLSYKQFQRIFSEYVGLNPKEFMRVIRFQKALYTLQNNPSISLTELTYICEFYDQSHLINEFKYFSGLTPGEYIAVCDPYSDYFSL